MTKITNPVPIYLDARGALLDAGKLYFGVANQDPQTSPIVVYWDKALTIVAAQPIRTLGGKTVNGQNFALVFTGEEDWSVRVRDANDIQVFYVPSQDIDAVDYQPLDDDLTAIAALSTTVYGRNLLTLANQAALRGATGIPDPLPAAGGSVTGDIVRGGAGVFTYWVDATQTSGRIFLTAEGAADPTSLAGDIWISY